MQPFDPPPRQWVLGRDGKETENGLDTCHLPKSHFSSFEGGGGGGGVQRLRIFVKKAQIRSFRNAFIIIIKMYCFRVIFLFADNAGK